MVERGALRFWLNCFAGLSNQAMGSDGDGQIGEGYRAQCRPPHVPLARLAAVSVRFLATVALMTPQKAIDDRYDSEYLTTIRLSLSARTTGNGLKTIRGAFSVFDLRPMATRVGLAPITSCWSSVLGMGSGYAACSFASRTRARELVEFGTDPELSHVFVAANTELMRQSVQYADGTSKSAAPVAEMQRRIYELCLKKEPPRRLTGGEFKKFSARHKGRKDRNRKGHVPPR
jgi:hypothetical protein